MNTSINRCQWHTTDKQGTEKLFLKTFLQVTGFLLLVFIINANTLAATDQTKIISPWSYAHKPQFSGFLKNETAYRIEEPRTYTKIRNIFYLQGNLKTPTSNEIHMSLRAYHDSVYDLFDYDTVAGRSVRDNDQPLAFVDGLSHEKDSDIVEFREFYADLHENNFDLRLGKQFIVWGVLTGVRVVDEINPMDFRELITPELLDYRVPLWSAKLDYYLGGNSLQIIGIPDLTFHQPAPKGSEWELFQEVPGTTYPAKRDPRNWELGVQWSGHAFDADYTLNYFYTWDDFPVLSRRAQIDSSGIITNPIFYPRFQRMHMFGGTAQREWGKFIFKSEVTFVKGKTFGLENTVDRNGDGYLDHNGILTRDHIRYGLGVDFNVLQTDFALSATQWAIFKYDPAMLMHQFDTSLNLYLMHNIPERNGVFDLLGIYLVQLKELYLKPKFSFRPSNQFQISMGMDLFWGQKSHLGVIAVDGDVRQLQIVTQSAQFIGNFNRNDRVFLELKYSF